MDCKYIVFTIAVIACQAGMIHSQCQQVNASSGTISDSFKTLSYSIRNSCWKIAVAAHYMISATVDLPKFNIEKYRNCDYAYVEIKMDNVRKAKFCGFDKIDNKLLFHTHKDSYFELVFYVNSRYYDSQEEYSFRLKYFIVPTIIVINGINEARENGINWLKSRHNPFWGWKEDTPRAVTALYLAGGAQFNGTLTEEMMVKQAELRTALALTWNSVSAERLSTFINALLTTCMKPRRFYGHDLVAKLKKQVESSGNFTHPAAYLALCNANETWPNRSTSDLSYVLTSKSDYRFIRDLQAFAIMALSCNYNRKIPSVTTEDNNLKTLYYETIKRMKKYQRADGSFGNTHTTALFTQALIASGQELIMDWRMNDNIKYLMKEMNTSGVNFLSVYATLPLLNRKTLVDISHINCTKNPRFVADDPLSELKDNQGPKIRVEYFLYIGNQKDVIHSISLRVPRNSTAYKVMELAALQDKKYDFKVETIDNVKHVYEIAGIPNDPEDGKFWLLYVKPKSSSGMSRYTSNPEGLILENEDQIVMWYETQQI